MARKRFHGSCLPKYGASAGLLWTATAALTTTEASEATCQAMPFQTPHTALAAASTASITIVVRLNHGSGV